MYNKMKPLFASNRGFYADLTLGTTTVGDPTVFPDNISFITWTIYIPSGIKAKLQASTFSPDKLTTPADNLDEYWVDWDLEGTPLQDSNGYVSGPITVQGNLPVVSGLRIVRETGSATEVLLGLRGQ